MMSRRWKWSAGVVVGVDVLVMLFVFTTWPRDILGAALTLHEDPVKSDVIIVLGGGTRKKDPNNLPPQAEQRVAKGVELYEAGFAPRLIEAGGVSPTTGLVEADLMSQLGLTRGVPAEVIFAERASRDTWENATNTLAIMAEQGWTNALVVTSPYHTKRACHFFRKQGGNVRCIAADYSLVPATDIYNRLMDNRSVLREYGAWIYAWFQGRV